MRRVKHYQIETLLPPTRPSILITASSTNLPPALTSTKWKSFFFTVKHCRNNCVRQRDTVYFSELPQICQILELNTWQVAVTILNQTLRPREPVKSANEILRHKKLHLDLLPYWGILFPSLGMRQKTQTLNNSSYPATNARSHGGRWYSAKTPQKQYRDCLGHPLPKNTFMWTREKSAGRWFDSLQSNRTLFNSRSGSWDVIAGILSYTYQLRVLFNVENSHYSNLMVPYFN